ncbi:MAG: hypothetical protein II939_10950 [Bacteroidales bacterium]|nr:hypothetical protein [Bacteroidales bacterium]
MEKRLIYLLILIVLAGCTTNPKSFPYEVFTDSVTVAPSKVVELSDYNVLIGWNFVRYKEWLIFRDAPSVTHNCIKAISPDFTKTSEAINMGNGPCDISQATSFLIYNDSLFLHDFNLSKMIHLDIVNDSIVANPYKTFSTKSMLTLIPFAEQRFLSASIIDSALIRITDLNDSVYFRQPYPPDETLQNMESFTQQAIYVNTSYTISPSKDKIAFGVFETGIYGFGRIITRDSLHFDKIIPYYSIKNYHIVEPYLIPDSTHILNVTSATSSDKYVFFLHHGGERWEIFKMIQSHRILVYTWDGEPYKMLTFKENPNLAKIVYDPERNILYGIALNPESQYVEIELDGVL